MPKRAHRSEHFEHIGERQVWGGYRPFGVSEESRRQHLYCLGKSGTGKTTLLRNLILQDIEAGRGVGLIDVHGDLAHEMLDLIPPHRTDDVVYFRPGDADCPIGFNLFHNVPPEKRHIVASNIVGAFKAIWRDSWGPRLEYLLNAAVASLLECPDTTMLGLQRIFVDAPYRHWVLRHVRDPVLAAFWTTEFDSWSAALRHEIILPVQNKIGQLLLSPALRNVLGQVKRKIDFRFMMDDRRIFIANLQKAELGDDKAALIGSLIVAGMQHAAFSRSDMPEASRVPFSLVVDEFQNFQTGNFATILSEARKYGLSLVLSHQFAGQLDQPIADAVFGNVGSIIAFRLGFADAERLADELGESGLAAELAGLPNHSAYARLIEGGRMTEPFLARTFPPRGERYGRRDNIIRRSREKYGVQRRIVEGKLAKWFRSTRR